MEELLQSMTQGLQIIICIIAAIVILVLSVVFKMTQSDTRKNAVLSKAHEESRVKRAKLKQLSDIYKTVPDGSEEQARVIRSLCDLDLTHEDWWLIRSYAGLHKKKTLEDCATRRMLELTEVKASD